MNRRFYADPGSQRRVRRVREKGCRQEARRVESSPYKAAMARPASAALALFREDETDVPSGSLLVAKLSDHASSAAFLRLARKSKRG